jgi:hypothetical protein
VSDPPDRRGKEDHGSPVYEYVKFEPYDLTITYAQNSAEFEYYLKTAEKLGYIETERGQQDYRFTVEGWKRSATGL